VNRAPSTSGPDFALQNHGSICLLSPLTDQAEEWLGENVVNDETQFWGRAIVVEPRYVEDLVIGIYGEGLTVAGLQPDTIN
jgi:hypothetical protein